MLRPRLVAFRPYILFVVGALVALALMFGYLRLEPPKGKYNDGDIKKLVAERMASATPSPPVAPQLYAQIQPSVVLITTREVPPGKTEAATGIGSGVVIDAAGLILTAYHVVAGTDTVRVHFFDGTTTSGQVTQKQPERDLAVVQVQSLPKGVDPATLGGGIEPGDDVLAFGAPLGFYGTVTRGVISGTDRSFKVEETGQQLNGLIQFDAAVNPGNSGGPLVDFNGRVVGIVTGIINPEGLKAFSGMGFAVPIEQANGIVAPLG